MKKLCVLLAGVLLCLLLPIAALGAETPTYTIMVYLCGTDLESDGNAATADILEMVNANLDVDGPVQLILQTGGTKQWAYDDIFDASCTQRWCIADDLYALNEDLGQQNMGASSTLEDFVSFGIEKYPADRYALILWDHGAGSTGGVCIDEYTGDSLSMAEIREALEGGLGGEKLDFIGFDACLMATFEMANHVSGYADYMIASQELEPGCGWSYEAWLSALKENPSMGGEELGACIVDSMVQDALEQDPNDYVTLSVVDLAKMDQVTDAVENMAQTLGNRIEEGQFNIVSRTRAGMRAMGEFYDVSSDMIDVQEFARGYQEMAPEASERLIQAVSEAVVYSRCSESVDSASGMTILMPYGTRESADEYLEKYDEFNLMKSYAGFIGGYVDLLNGGDYQFENTQMISVADSGSSDIAGWFSEFVAAEDREEALDQYGEYAYAVQLSEDEMYHLSYVEATLMLDVSDDEMEAYVDLGYMQDVTVDWDKGIVCGLFDGNWPTLEGQMVSMTDQIVTENYVRSIIPVTVNGSDEYLLVVFNEQNPKGIVVGYSKGYDDNGNPMRGYTSLQPGDVVVPRYDLLYWDESGDTQTESFEGDPITVGAGGSLSFGYDAVEEGSYQYAYCLNDVYGAYQFTEFVEFTF